MKTSIVLTVAVALTLTGAGAVAVTAPAAFAQEGAQEGGKDLTQELKKVGREARLAAVDGNYEELSKILQGASEEIRNDPDLRFQVAENILKSIKKLFANERLPGLEAARDSFAVAAKGKPEDNEAVVGALKCSDEIAELHVLGNKPSDAKRHAAWAVSFGEGIMEKGNTTAPVKVAVAAAYRMRAKTSHKVKELDQIVSDFDRAGVLIDEILAAGDPLPADLGAAAETFLAKARFIHDAIPIDEETRDDDAVRKAVEFANRACAMKGAEAAEFNAQLQSLRTARAFGITDDLGKPAMQLLKPGVKGLKLEVPRADGWKNEKVAKDQTYDLYFTRQFEGEGKAVQIMVTEWAANEVSYGLPWNRLPDIAQSRAEGQAESFERVTSSVPLMRLGTGGKTGKKAEKAKGVEIWHFQLAGVKTGGREARQAEWMWRESKSAKYCYQIQIYDYGTPWGLDDPDVQAFISAALGADNWPDAAVVVQQK